MKFDLPELPYEHEALEPTISPETMHFHHDKHHAKYIDTLNKALAENPSFAPDLEGIVRKAKESRDDPAMAKLFNNAAQAWNHTFFWSAMTPNRTQPGPALAAAIDKAFGGLEQLKAEFVSKGEGQFGSGWVWLAVKDGALTVIATHDADDTLILGGVTPLLVCDVWEHAYYLDYQNDRGGFLKTWFDAVPNWTLADRQFAAANGDGEVWKHPLPH